MKQRLNRMLLGGCCGVAAALLLTLLVNFIANSITWGGGSPDYTGIQLTFDRCAARFGSAGAAVAVEWLSVFALGAAVGLATLPFAGTWAAMLGLSAAHFVITGGLALLVGWSYQWLGMGPGDGPRTILILYVVIYLLIWLIRWLIWYAEVRRIRAALGLDHPKREG